MKVGYARCSTSEQNIDVQMRRLREAGCEKIFYDVGQSGAKASRPYWDECRSFLRRGDCLVAVKLDRFGRSLQNLLEVMADFEAKGIELQCLDQPIDTTSPTGRLLFGILACISEFERDLITSRTMDGLAAARARGHFGGRKREWTDAQAQAIVALRAQGNLTMTEVASAVGISRASAYRALNAYQASLEAVAAS